jgi:hypothetical protein
LADDSLNFGYLNSAAWKAHKKQEGKRIVAMKEAESQEQMADENGLT